jgi:hypothetical protein
VQRPQQPLVLLRGNLATGEPLVQGRLDRSDALARAMGRTVASVHHRTAANSPQPNAKATTSVQVGAESTAATASTTQATSQSESAIDQ